MAESNPGNGAAAPADGAGSNSQADAGVVFNMQKVYVKDMSMEIPHAPAIFLETEPPSLETQLNIDAQNFSEALYELVVTATVTTRIKDRVAFLVEMRQAGIFEIRNFPQDQMDALLGIHCAGTLYPYLRANVADIVVRAGFPALHLPNVNFEAFYAQRLQQIEEAKRTGAEPPATTIIAPQH
ncbi:MAG: protein-export chaperone SecB [Burkholderiales bacterium]|nr:protein-export chaperone SecB [Burkholderiales bacterium]